METQAIILDNVYFCVVFRFREQVPQIVDKHSTEVPADLRAWLAQNDYPTNGQLLKQQHGANLAHGYYIKPYPNDRYFKVYEDDQTDDVNPDQFDQPIRTENGF
jgi:hypothetical protein